MTMHTHATLTDLAGRFLFASSYHPMPIGDMTGDLEAARAQCPAITGQTWLDLVNARQDALLADDVYAAWDRLFVSRRVAALEVVSELPLEREDTDAPEAEFSLLRWQPEMTPCGQRLQLVHPPDTVAEPADVRLLVSLAERLRAEVEQTMGGDWAETIGQLAAIPLTKAGWRAYERLYPWPHAGGAPSLDLARQLTRLMPAG